MIVPGAIALALAFLLAGCPLVGNFELEQPIEGDVFYADDGYHEAKVIWTDMKVNTLEMFHNGSDVTGDLIVGSGQATLPLTTPSGKYLVAAKMRSDKSLPQWKNGKITSSKGVPQWKKATYFVTPDTDTVVTAPLTYEYGSSFLNSAAQIPGSEDLGTLFEAIDVVVDPATSGGNVTLIVHGMEDLKDFGIGVLVDEDVDFEQLTEPDNGMVSEREIRVTISPAELVGNIEAALADLETLSPGITSQIPADVFAVMDALETLPDFGFDMLITVLPANDVGTAQAAVVADLSSIFVGEITLPGDSQLFTANYYAD